jgi:DNA-binding transcriptional LysR family regulator
MDKFKQIETFVAVASKGGLSPAALVEGVAPAIIGRRIDALEARLGVKLLVRTTRKVSLTFEGAAFLEDCQRLLRDMLDAEASVSAGGVKASGHLRVTAPAGFGRKHVAPLIPEFRVSNPDVSVSLDLSDRLADIVNESIDIAVRIGQLDDSSLVGVKLAKNRRVVVASPSYLARSTPITHPKDLQNHECLTFGNYGNQSRGWQFKIADEVVSLRVRGDLECNDGAVLHEWSTLGKGLAWRSEWEVQDDLRCGRLVEVLKDFRAPDNAIYAVIAQRKHMPLRVRMFIEALKLRFGQPDYWINKSAQALEPEARPRNP